jgi:hypothetical protein
VLKFLLVVAVFAALVYALMWALERRRAAGAGGGTTKPRRNQGPPPRQVAPDDDEDFLRWLERKRRKDSPES